MNKGCCSVSPPGRRWKSPVLKFFVSLEHKMHKIKSTMRSRVFASPPPTSSSQQSSSSSGASSSSWSKRASRCTHSFQPWNLVFSQFWAPEQSHLRWKTTKIGKQMSALATILEINWSSTCQIRSGAMWLCHLDVCNNRQWYICVCLCVTVFCILSVCLCVCVCMNTCLSSTGRRSCLYTCAMCRPLWWTQWRNLRGSSSTLWHIIIIIIAIVKFNPLTVKQHETQFLWSWIITQSSLPMLSPSN